MLIRVFVVLLLLSGALSHARTPAAWPLLPSESDALQQRAADGLQELNAGVFRFHYLNEEYQSALNALAELRRGGVPAADGYADLLETTLLLALGLEDKAREQFQRGTVLQAPADAWFYLARRWYASANWDLTLEALEYALGQASVLSPQYRQEALFMRVSSLVELGDIDEAARMLTAMADTGLWSGMARHNVLLGRIRSYAPIHEIERLVREAVYYLPAKGEGSDLRDRVRLLAGIYSLESGRYREAERYLQDVSLSNAYTAPALLQFGWARMEQFEYEKALQPWRILQQQFQPWHPAVVEFVLAVPYSLESMNATTQALRSYEHVEQRLQSMLDELVVLQQESEIQQWLSDWLQQQSGGWGWSRHEVAEAADSPMSRAMMALLADTSFQQQLGQLHDLQRMHSDILQQQRTMGLWQDLLVQRRQDFERVNAAERLKALNMRREQLQRQVSELQQRWQDEDRQLFAYASENDQRHLEHLDNVVPRIAFLQRINTPTRDLGIYKERWRRTRGVLLWQMYEQQPQRRWESEQNFWQLQQELANLEEQLNNSRLALDWADSRWLGLDPRIAEGQQSAAEVVARIDQLQKQQKVLLVSDIRLHLQELHARLTHYQAQSRLAIARLYDDALQQRLSSATAETLMSSPAEVQP